MKLPGSFGFEPRQPFNHPLGIFVVWSWDQISTCMTRYRQVVDQRITWLRIGRNLCGRFTVWTPRPVSRASQEQGGAAADG
jgi:hypothetical protein